jgi:hypothetical protein
VLLRNYPYKHASLPAKVCKFVDINFEFTRVHQLNITGVMCYYLILEIIVLEWVYLLNVFDHTANVTFVRNINSTVSFLHHSVFHYHLFFIELLLLLCPLYIHWGLAKRLSSFYVPIDVEDGAVRQLFRGVAKGGYLLHDVAHPYQLHPLVPFGDHGIQLVG